MADLFNGAQLKLQDGSTVDGGEFLKGKMVALYFSAGFCPPCRLFTPKLKRFYNEIKETHPEFEVVFVSKDEKEEDMNEYFEDHQGEWAAVPHGDAKIKELFEKYEVKGIPAMLVVKPDGSVAVKDAKAEIVERAGDDAEGLFESWECFHSM